MPKIWTPEDQDESLVNFVEIDPKFWELIPYGSFVRYYLVSGEYRFGGYVARNPFDEKPVGSTETKRYMKLQNGFNPKYFSYKFWTVSYETVSKIFVKLTASEAMVLQLIETATRGLNENMRKLADHIKKLEAAT